MIFLKKSNIRSPKLGRTNGFTFRIRFALKPIFSPTRRMDGESNLFLKTIYYEGKSYECPLAVMPRHLTAIYEL